MGRADPMPAFRNISHIEDAVKIIAVISSSKAMYFDIDRASRCFVCIQRSDAVPRGMCISDVKLWFIDAMRSFTSSNQLSIFII